jgi:hypothetical protein
MVNDIPGRGDKGWINSNMFCSIATILRIDIVIAIIHLSTGNQVCKTLQVHRAGPYPTIPHPADLLPQLKSCQWAPPPPPGVRRLRQDSLIILVNTRALQPHGYVRRRHACGRWQRVVDGSQLHYRHRNGCPRFDHVQEHADHLSAWSIALLSSRGGGIFR